jgi:hypothetical protein
MLMEVMEVFVSSCDCDRNDRCACCGSERASGVIGIQPVLSRSNKVQLVEQVDSINDATARCNDATTQQRDDATCGIMHQTKRSGRTITPAQMYQCCTRTCNGISKSQFLNLGSDPVVSDTGTASPKV